MSEPIIIKTPQPVTEERLVLVPPGTVSPTYGERGTVLTIHTDDARDATPADLARGGYERLGPEVLRVSAAEWHAMKLRAEGREAHGEPGTLAHLRNDLRDAEKRAEKAERERDEARRLHSAAEAQVACRNELRAQVAAAEGRFRAAEAERDALRAEVERLTAPGEGSEGGPWRAYGEPTDQELVDAFEHAYSNAPSVRTHATAIRTIYRLGVARAGLRDALRARERATDEELEDLYNAAFDAGPSGVHDSRVVALRAVAARVRQERCLVAQAVAANVDIRVAEDDGGGFMIGVHAPGCDEEFVRCVPVAEVPATLARLLGEVGRG